jgi:5-methylcytosine-specific restriction endonuclease McrA
VKTRKTEEEKKLTRKLYIQRNKKLYADAMKRWRSKLDPELKQRMAEAKKAYKAVWNKGEKGRASMLAAKQRRRSRLRALGGPGVSRQEWLWLCSARADEQGNVRCTWCNEICKPTMDHVTPITRGGAHVASNIVVACLSCNSSRGNRLIHEWPKGRKMLPASLIAAFEASAKEAQS